MPFILMALGTVPKNWEKKEAVKWRLQEVFRSSSTTKIDKITERSHRELNRLVVT